MDHWTKQYLKFLEVEINEPSYDLLQQLVEAHLHRIPFEIISKYHYYSSKNRNDLIPSKDEFLDHLHNRAWGGNCYILNLHFKHLLDSLGFETHIVMAKGGNPHLGLMVKVKEQVYYTDVGYMAPFFEPLVLEEEPCFIRCGEEVMVKRVSDKEYLIDRRSGGQSFVKKTIEWVPVELDAFTEPITYAHRDEDENPFMRRIVAVIFKDRVSYTVINSKLMIKSDKDIQVIDYTNREEWLQMMQSTFNLKREDLEFALDFLKERNVEVFVL